MNKSHKYLHITKSLFKELIRSLVNKIYFSTEELNKKARVK